MRDLRPVSEDGLFWHFAVAEIRSDRYGETYSQVLGPELTSSLRRNSPPELSALDRAKIRAGVMRIRGPLLLPLLKLTPSWLEGELTLEELPRVRVMNYPPLVAIAPSRELQDFARALDGPGPLDGDQSFIQNYRRTRPDFDPVISRGLPIVVAPVREGPFTQIEGLTRLASLESMRRGGKLQASGIRVLLGVTNRFQEWPLR